jgi:hypothetical protein
MGETAAAGPVVVELVSLELVVLEPPELEVLSPPSGEAGSVPPQAAQSRTVAKARVKTVLMTTHSRRSGPGASRNCCRS